MLPTAQYGMKAMCTAHVPCTKASSGAQVGAQPLIFGSGAHKIFLYLLELQMFIFSFKENTNRPKISSGPQ